MTKSLNLTFETYLFLFPYIKIILIWRWWGKGERGIFIWVLNHNLFWVILDYIETFSFIIIFLLTMRIVLYRNGCERDEGKDELKKRKK